MDTLYRRNENWDSMLITLSTKPRILLKNQIILEVEKNCEYESIDIIEFQVIKVEMLEKQFLTILVSFAILD